MTQEIVLDCLFCFALLAVIAASAIVFFDPSVISDN